MKRLLYPFTPLTMWALAACNGGNAPAAARPRLPPLVAVAPVEFRDVPVEVRAPLDLRPLTQADVGSKVLGYLDAVLVDRGDRVRKGQTLALVRPSDLPDQLVVARASQAQAEANLQRARLDLERTESLFQQGSSPQASLDLAQANFNAAQSALDAAKGAVSGLGVRLGETRITAPMDGVISARKLDPGALVGTVAGAAVLTVDRTDVLRAFVPVPEREAGSVSIGQAAFIELDAVKGKRFEGKVVRLAPSFDVQSRTLDAEVHLLNPDNLLRPGMYGRGYVVTATHTNAAVVPITALQVGGLGKHVFVLNGEKVERRVVEAGVDGDTWVEITAGLKPGDEVVVAGVESLSDGAAVRVSRNVDPIKGQPLTAPTAAKKEDPLPAPSVR